MRGEWEVYFRCGYTVTGTTDVIVSEWERTDQLAAKKAEFAAQADIARLKELGIGAEVTIWTERWKTRQVRESDDRVIQGVHTVERRTERAEWRDPEDVGVAVNP